MDFLDVTKIVGGYEFVPTFEGNDKLKPTDPKRMSVKLKPMSHKLQRSYDRMLRVKMVDDQMESNQQDIKDLQWAECVLSFNNTNIVDPATKESRPMTPEEAYDILPTKLIREIQDEIENQSSFKPEEKKL
jgi:hypothetical protein